jgi:hypothetical protein
MKIGDLVRVNSNCDAGGLWYKTGVVVEIKKNPFRERGLCARVLLQGRLHLFNIKHLDTINESG